MVGPSYKSSRIRSFESDGEVWYLPTSGQRSVYCAQRKNWTGKSKQLITPRAQKLK